MWSIYFVSPSSPIAIHDSSDSSRRSSSDSDRSDRRVRLGSPMKIGLIGQATNTMMDIENTPGAEGRTLFHPSNPQMSTSVKDAFIKTLKEEQGVYSYKLIGQGPNEVRLDQCSNRNEVGAREGDLVRTKNIEMANGPAN